MLRSRLRVELLTDDESNKEIIRSFRADRKGKALEYFLKENAWDEDRKGVTKVYLVKDSDNVVFFFALSAGLLYKGIGSEDSKLSREEKEIVDLCVDAYLKGNERITTDEVFSWYKDEHIDQEKLRRVIEERIKFKTAAKDDLEKSENSIYVQRVLKTFPGIVLTHFCRNAGYTFPEKLAFPIGFYVFWEIVVDQILFIASLLGCQYLYLFAADNTEQASSDITGLYPDDWDLDDTGNTSQVYKLVEYYKNELKFEDVQNVTVLKPYYDFSCFSLIQETKLLSEHRVAAWIQHSDVND